MEQGKGPLSVNQTLERYKFMAGSSFGNTMKTGQIAWRKRALSNQTAGFHNKRSYDHILPRAKWELNLWSGIRSGSSMPLPDYLKKNSVQRHTGSHNLCSSWIMCANLYFPFCGSSGRELLAGFLRDEISSEISAVSSVELEYVSSAVSPGALGETGGSRGSAQTSPDVAFEVTTNVGPGVVLVECKFIEHSFYPCSGRKKSNNSGRAPNPNPSRCQDFGKVLSNPKNNCHLATWQRTYWDFLEPITDKNAGARLDCCPAAYGGYQLMRQHALAEAIALSGQSPFVVSAVAYDERNSGLMKCMSRSTHLADIRSDWAPLFRGKAQFSVFPHQKWVTWVRSHSTGGAWSDWLEYVGDRYGF